MDRWPSNLPIDGLIASRAELLHGPERRRRWSADEKSRIVAESLEPGVVARHVAFRHRLHPNQLYAWRHALRSEAAAGVEFAPVVVTGTAEPGGCRPIEIVVGNAVVRVGRGADIGLLGEIVGLLKRLV
jgi:transposase